MELKKRKKYLIVLPLLISCLFTCNNIQAEDNYSQDDENEVFDYDRSGFEDWLPDYNPRTREMYGGYNRAGSFYVASLSSGSVRVASYMNAYWKSGGGVGLRYTTPSGVVEKTSDIAIKEYAEATGTFTLKRNCTVFSYPIFHSRFMTAEVLPAGNYTVVKEALEFVELQKPNGSKVWVAPQYANNGSDFYATNYGFFNASKAILSASSVNGKAIKQWMMPIREDKRTGIAMQPKYVTIHNTGNSGSGANAWSHANGQINDKRTWVSWHYTVDNNEIYQSIPMNEAAYHAGDGVNIGNAATIGIEICENADGSYAQAERNAAYLTAQILYENNMPADAVRMHKDWSGKQCAKNILEGTKGTMGWANFKALVQQEYNRLVEVNKPVVDDEVDETIPTGFEKYIKDTKLTFKDGMATGFTLGSSVTQVMDSMKAIDSTANVKILRGDSVVSEGKIATGQRIVVTDAANKTFTFSIVIKGDVTGDGEVFATDYVKIKNYIMGNGTLNKVSKNAADVTKDTNIYATDYVLIKNHIMGKGSLTQ